MADKGSDELVDPQDTLRSECHEESECVKLFERLQTCNDRVNSKSATTESCHEEMLDYMHCVDHCVSKSLFKYLK